MKRMAKHVKKNLKNNFFLFLEKYIQNATIIPNMLPRKKVNTTPNIYTIAQNMPKYRSNLVFAVVVKKMKRANMRQNKNPEQLDVKE